MSELRIGPLVRATSADTVVIWAELSEHCDVQLRITPDDTQLNDAVLSLPTTTVQVGGHYYIAPQMRGLQPSTWYRYALFTGSDGKELTTKNGSPLFQCFRTFDTPTATTSLDDDKRHVLRIAYGSCRKANDDASDALHAFGLWLQEHYTQREEIWPHLLLCIGDQIYADEPPAAVIQSSPQLADGARTFEDFCTLYTYAWSHDPAVQQVLATLPTFMIFDDHEVTNNWNVEPAWQSKVIGQGNEQLLIDALVAYWVYQGWGNLVQDEVKEHPLLTIMHDATQSGEDALEKLRYCIREDIYKLAPIRWHYSIPTHPAIFVANARTERTTILDQSSARMEAPLRIMSQGQMQDIQQWLEPQEQNPSIFVSSVPILLPPLIGMLQYLTGERLWTTPEHPAPLRWLGRRLARLQKAVAHKVSFDHWPLYTATWHEFLHLVLQKQQEMIILGGDVHFSYSLVATPVKPGKKLRGGCPQAGTRLYQFVSTPFQNVLDDASERKVKVQAFITNIAYSGLHLHMLPLKATGAKVHMDKEILFENTLAFLTLYLQPGGNYQIKHEYMSSINGEAKMVGYTVLSS